jgi:hypothetical protein
MIDRIDANTRLNKILELHPAILDYIVSLNPHDFKRLYNPFMRRIMSPRITIGRVAAMVEKPITTILNRISEISGVKVEQSDEEIRLTQSQKNPPDWLTYVNRDRVKQVDLLPSDETLDSDPMFPIMVAIKGLAGGEILLIKHKWEPQPLYDIWIKMGNIDWFAEKVHEDEWRIWVHKKS